MLHKSWDRISSLFFAASAATVPTQVSVSFFHWGGLPYPGPYAWDYFTLLILRSNKPKVSKVLICTSRF